MSAALHLLRFPPVGEGFFAMMCIAEVFGDPAKAWSKHPLLFFH